jgi:hypothetical protein
VIDLRAATEGTGVEVSAAVAEDVLVATFAGSAEMQAFEALKKVVTALHEEALAQHVLAVAVDFTQLEFMSSSCFKCLVSWIGDITELPEGRQYKIRFRSSTEQLWQRRSLHVLQTFATDLVTIET